MKISLVVTAMDREFELKRLFTSLVQNNIENLEVVFVDQNGCDKNKEIVELYKKEINIKHIHIRKQASLSKARNIGLEHVTGELIGFPDDDCWYPKDFFINLIKNFDKFNADYVCCSVYDPIENQNYSNKHSDKAIIKMNSKNAFIYTTSVGIFYKVYEKDKKSFDETLGVGAMWYGGEDLDFVLSLIKEGYKGIFINDLKVYHQIEKDSYNYEKIYKYSIGFGAILKKSFLSYGNIYGLLIFIEKFLKISIKVIYYKITNNTYEEKNLSSILKGLIYGFINYKGKGIYNE